ncbi:MAG: hypothetical protein R2766_08535 [Saprospiraceae bacterium]
MNIDVQYKFNNCSFYMEEGSQIVNSYNGSSGQFWLVNSFLYGCDHMWKGIVNHGKMLFYNNKSTMQNMD